MISVPLAAGGVSNALILSNTVMGFAAGIALLLMVPFARHGANAARPVRRAWAWCFAVLGALLAIFGIHTSLTWPLLGAANLIFGEPSAIFGGLLLGAAAIIYYTPIESADAQKLSDRSVDSESKTWAQRFRELRQVEQIPDELLIALRPIAYVGVFTGPMLVLLAVGGAVFGKIVFRPPPSEFPTGIIAGTGIESIYFIVTYSVLGLGAFLLPFGMHNRSWLRPAAYLLVLAGILLLIVTFASFLGHVTLSSGVPPGGIPWPPG